MGMEKTSKRYLFTSESVTEGHPDKVCDQVSDAILDSIYTQDPHARVACEVAATTGLIIIMGEITSNAVVDVQSITRQTLLNIGYDHIEYGLDGARCGILVTLGNQSPDIAMGVEKAFEARYEKQDDPYSLIGAGDQGLMFGYATNETPEIMPLPISLAHRLAQRLAFCRKAKEIPYLRPDGKTQVTIEYDGNTPVRVHTVVISAQHSPDVDQKQIAEDIFKNVIEPVIPESLRDDRTRYLVNPTGRFVVGGPQGDSGLTGRKIIADTYGGAARHGGGALSGKDPTKVDRSSTYAARYVAKNIVGAGLAQRCEVQVAYAIGVAKPVSIMVDTFGTGKVSDEILVQLVEKTFDLRPAAIIETLDLRRPIYFPTSVYGHFGRSDMDFPWERLDKVNALLELVGYDSIND
jgi:S-adenosylmethionine synthetase